MRVELNPCYILHNRSYRETSLLLDVFSRQHGRISLIAKGGRKQKNDKRALLQPGQKVNIAWTARRELGTLTLVEPYQGNRPSAGSGLLTIFYVNELLVKLLHQHEPHHELFDAYDEAINNLSNKSVEQMTLRIFEKRLLESLGYGLVLDSDTEGNSIKTDKYYNYLVEQGPVLCEESAGNGPRVSGRTLLALAEENLNEDGVLTEAKQLMRMLIGNLLGNKTLVSRELYKFQLEYTAEK